MAHPLVIIVGTATFSCVATVKAPPLYHAAKAMIVKPAPTTGNHAKHNRPTSRPAHINTKTVPACSVGILPISGVTGLWQPDIPMVWDDGDAPHETGSSSLATGSRSYEISRPSFVGAAGGGSPGGGGTVAPKPTPTPTESPVAAALPEPGTWAMMLAGFGMVGLASRLKARRVGTAMILGE